MQRREMLFAGALAATLPVLAPRLAAAQPKQAGWPRALTMGTAAPGGTYALYGPAWGQMAQAATGVAISYRTTQGPNQNILLVERKEVEIAMTTMGVALQAWEGKGDWTQGKQFREIRALFPMYDTPFHGIALKRSGITRFAQLEGKNIGVGPRGGTPGTYFPIIMNTLGYKPGAVRYGSGSDMAGQLQDGLLDAYLFASGIPVPSFSEAETQGDVVFLDFTEAEVAKLTAALPELSPGTIPASTYRTAGRDLRVVGMFNFAIAHRSLDEGLVYAIVKAVMDGNAQLVQAIAAARETVPANAAKNGFLPFHPGAARYFREKGINLPDKLVAA
ncbi:TAXI family TRAP transporter solute-binding subunit [Teichococcus aestuarii]|uniref:TAXI family TRAP transporter solute-binding subunit n=1 Tax=Teichococcus aestuarii TaxID=568898 RepID=UPI00361F18CC